MLRELMPEEHGKTRGLWEEIFTDDTKDFLDYYYFIKARNNRILVIEEEGALCSMLQMNPYKIQVERQKYDSAYIIAVATKEKFRRRGYMGNLLRNAFQIMYAKKIPFTFLMPAAEKIYLPYDFRYIYVQNRSSILIGESNETVWENCKSEEEPGTERNTDQIEFSDAVLWNAQEMADFFNDNFADLWQVYSVRDEEYYRTMILEQQSEHGGVRLMRKNGRIVGMYAYADEAGPEIREPLYLPETEKEFLRSVLELVSENKMRACINSSEKKCIRRIMVYASPKQYVAEEKPLIMARIISLKEMLESLTVPAGQMLECSFAVIDPIIKNNSRIWKISSDKGNNRIKVTETEDSHGVIPIAELTSFIFGQCSVDELALRPGVIMNEKLKNNLGLIHVLSNVFFNEVV